MIGTHCWIKRNSLRWLYVQLLDAKLQPILSRKRAFESVLRSNATSKQIRDRVQIMNKNPYVVPNMVKKLEEAKKITIGEQSLQERFEGITIEIWTKPLTSDSVKIYSQPEVDPNSTEEEKEDQLKKDENFKRLQEFQIELDQ